MAADGEYRNEKLPGKDPNTTDTNRNLFFFNLWLLSITGLHTIDVFFEGGISTSDDVIEKLPVWNFEMSLLP